MGDDAAVPFWGSWVVMVNESYKDFVLYL